MKRILIFLLIIVSVFYFKPISAQTTDNPVTLGAGNTDELRIEVKTGGYYIIKRWLYNPTAPNQGWDWHKQFFREPDTQLFSIRIGTEIFCSRNGYTSPNFNGTPVTAFSSIQDVGSPVTTGTHQEATKIFTATYNGNPFSVTIKIMYNTTSPELLIKEATIDATNIPAGTSIRLAYGWDTYLGVSDTGYAYILPDIFGLNGNSAEANRYLTTAQVQQFRLVGTRNNSQGGAVIGFFPIDVCLTGLMQLIPGVMLIHLI